MRVTKNHFNGLSLSLTSVRTGFILFTTSVVVKKFFTCFDLQNYQRIFSLKNRFYFLTSSFLKYEPVKFDTKEQEKERAESKGKERAKSSNKKSITGSCHLRPAKLECEVHSLFFLPLFHLHPVLSIDPSLDVIVRICQVMNKKVFTLLSLYSSLRVKTHKLRVTRSSIPFSFHNSASLWWSSHYSFHSSLFLPPFLSHFLSE